MQSQCKRERKRPPPLQIPTPRYSFAASRFTPLQTRYLRSITPSNCVICLEDCDEEFPLCENQSEVELNGMISKRQHGVCKECAPKLVEFKTQQCPMCRVPFETGTISSLKNNSYFVPTQKRTPLQDELDWYRNTVQNYRDWYLEHDVPAISLTGERTPEVVSQPGPAFAVGAEVKVNLPGPNIQTFLGAIPSRLQGRVGYVRGSYECFHDAQTYYDVEFQRDENTITPMRQYRHSRYIPGRYLLPVVRDPHQRS